VTKFVRSTRLRAVLSGPGILDQASDTQRKPYRGIHCLYAAFGLPPLFCFGFRPDQPTAVPCSSGRFAAGFEDVQHVHSATAEHWDGISAVFRALRRPVLAARTQRCHQEIAYNSQTPVRPADKGAEDEVAYKTVLVAGVQVGAREPYDVRAHKLAPERHRGLRDRCVVDAECVVQGGHVTSRESAEPEGAV